MAQWLQVGDRWVNLDQVADVHFVRPIGKPNDTVRVNVTLVDGANVLTFDKPDEIAIFDDFLRAHRAT